MKRCFLIIATGKDHYFQLALNLCLSIKQNGSCPVFLIYSGTGISVLGKRQDWFDGTSFIADKYTNPAQQAFWLKLNLYDIVTRSAMFHDCNEFILLDADTLVLPGKDLNDWWAVANTYHFHNQGKLNIENHFVAYTNNLYRYSNGEFKMPNANFWCDPVEAKEYFKIPSYSAMPQINASFVYFRRSDKAAMIFETALEVWNDDKFPTKVYRGTKTEEVCFNIACANQGVVPASSIPFRPLYMQVYSEQRDETYIQHRFNAISMAGHINHDQRIVSLYNRLSDYYRACYGIQDKFHFNQEMKIMKEQRPIYGYWHVACMGDWKKVVKEQLQMLRESGLLHATKRLWVGCVYEDYNDMLWLDNLCEQYLNITIYNGGALNHYEFPTLLLLRSNVGSSKEPHFGYYIHTKGVSDPRGKHWRDYLNYYNITKWRECQGKLRIGHDLCGVKLIENNPAHPMHYSGNFWHFDSEYIKTLKPVEELDWNNRFNAEMWVCSGRPNAATLSQVQVDHFNKPKFKPSIFDNLKKLFTWR